MSTIQTLRTTLHAQWERLTLVRYVAASGVAALTDWTLFLVLARTMVPEAANAVSYSTAMVINFTMQRRMVFRDIRRGLLASFLISMGLSFIGLLLNTLTLYLMRQVLPGHLVVPKLVATGLVFIYNYYSKKHLAFGVSRAKPAASNPAPVQDTSSTPLT